MRRAVGPAARRPAEVREHEGVRSLTVPFDGFLDVVGPQPLLDDVEPDAGRRAGRCSPRSCSATAAPRAAAWWLAPGGRAAVPAQRAVRRHRPRAPARRRGAAGSDLDVVAGVLPAYGLFIAAGFACYAFVISEGRRFLEDRAGGLAPGSPRWAVHAVCAVGVVLGRVARLNSWEPVTEPVGTLERVVLTLSWRWAPVAVVATFLVIWAGHAVTRAAARAAVSGAASLTAPLAVSPRRRAAPRAAPDRGRGSTPRRRSATGSAGRRGRAASPIVRRGRKNCTSGPIVTANTTVPRPDGPTEQPAGGEGGQLDARAHEPDRADTPRGQPGHQAVPRARSEAGADVEAVPGPHRTRRPRGRRAGRRASPACRARAARASIVDADEEHVEHRAEAGPLAQGQPGEQHDGADDDADRADGDAGVVARCPGRAPTTGRARGRRRP